LDLLFMKSKEDKKKLDEERSEIVFLWDKWFEIPLIILGFCWLGSVQK